MALNVRPILHNIIAFHLTGQKIYAKQARQNLSAILHLLKERGCPSLHDFILVLLEDINNGASLLDWRMFLQNKWKTEQLNKSLQCNAIVSCYGVSAVPNEP
jgi:hypothetical protein